MSTNSERFQKHSDRVAGYDILFKDNFENVMQLPKLDKIVLNTGIGKQAVLDRKRTVEALFTMELITGQKARITRAKKSIDKFKLREKMPIGCKTTLRKQNAFRLLDRVIHTALPNIEGFVVPSEIRKAQPGRKSNIKPSGNRDGFFSPPIRSSGLGAAPGKNARRIFRTSSHL